MNQRLEHYLGEAEQQLHSLPDARRKEELEEMRQHLTASVAANEELGLDTTSATEESIRQFGAARQVGSGLKHVWWREQIGGPRGLWKTAALALALRFVINGLLSPVSILLAMTAARAVHETPANLGLADLAQALMIMAAALPALLSGIVLSKVSPRNAVAGAALGGAICIIVAIMDLFAGGATSVIVYNERSSSTAWAHFAREPFFVLLTVLITWLAVLRERKRMAKVS